MRRAQVRTLLLIVIIILLVPQQWRAAERKSELGLYSGYSQPVYTEWVRKSIYITMTDGIKLAADLFQPAENKVAVTTPMPVIWTQQRYGRAFMRDGKLTTQLDKEPWLQTMVQYGYVVGIVDARGSGASYGTWPGPFVRREAQDSYDVTEWFARQPWCNGQVGMFGRSYMAVTQYLAAGMLPPHLKAIMPEMPTFDLYSAIYSGGVFRDDYAVNWNRLMSGLDADPHIAPTDEDNSREMLGTAIRNHAGNQDLFKMANSLRYRDSKDDPQKMAPYLDWNPIRFIPQINKSNVAVYNVTGWFDLRPRDAIVWFSNLKNPQKLLIGPWFHTQSEGLDVGAERLRWFDCWLKGIDNGIMSDAPIHYYTIGAPPAKAWRSAEKWPLPNQELTSYYFHDVGNDGTMDLQVSQANDQRDYAIDYSTTSGTATRWTNGYAGAAGYRAMTTNDGKAATYTTSPLPEVFEVTGHPVVHLWMKSTAPDNDVFVYLEDVDDQGISHYVTEGTLRASHRSIDTPEFSYLGLPYHKSSSSVVRELPKDQVVELVMDLSPVSYLFARGHRIRIAITGADKGNAQTPELSPSPIITIYNTAEHASRVILPVIPVSAELQSEPEGSQQVTSPVAEPAHIWQLRNIVIALVAITAAAVLLKRRKR